MRTFLRFLIFSLLAIPIVVAQQTNTPNLALQVPYYGQLNWNVPMAYDLNLLDSTIAGTQTLATGSTPGVSQYRNWVTQNSAPTTITNLGGGLPNQPLRLVCGSSDTFTNINNGGNFLLAGTWSCATSRNLDLIYYSGVWQEVARFGAGTGSAYYQTIQVNGIAVTQEPVVNYIPGTNITFTCVDNPGIATNCTMTASVTAATSWSAITAAANNNAGNFTASGNSWDFSAANSFKMPTAGLILPGVTSGTVTLTVPALAGTSTATLPANTGTVAELNLGQTWTALQTFGTNISFGNINLGTPTGIVLTNASGLPCTALPALTGDTTTSAGSCVTSTTKINGATFPNGALVLGTNSSSQPIVASAANVSNLLQNLSGCGVPGNIYVPQGNNCVTPSTGTTTNALTFSGSGSGAPSGSTFNGSAAVTISYNTIGALSATATASGDLSGSYPGPSVIKINGVVLPTISGATGVLYDTAGTLSMTNAPALSAANMTSFPTLNQNTTGTSANITGQLALSQLNGGVAPSGQSYDFTGVTILKFRASAGLTTSANGDIGLDTTNDNLHVWNGADAIYVPLAPGFVSGHCGQLTQTSGKWSVVDSGGPCGTSGGGVTSVSNTDSSLTISPTTGAVVASLNTGHANTWTALQTFGTNISIGNINLGTPTAISLTNATGLPCTALPALSGDTTSGAGSCVTTVGKLENITLPTLASATGVIYDTNGTLSLTNAPALSAANMTSFPTLNQSTIGSAASLSVSGQTGLITFTGITSTNRVLTIRDASDTLLELGGSYTPTGTWNWTSVVGTWPTFNQSTTGNAATATALSTTGANGTFWGVSGGVQGYYTPAASGTVNNCSTSGANAYYAGTGTAVSCDPSMIVNGATLTLGISGTSAGSVAFNNATSGSVTLTVPSGALGSVTATLPANTGTIAELNLAQSWTALQTFGTNISIGNINLGTPTGIVLTNGTSLPITTGVSGLGTGVATFLATPSSANLAAAMTDETGTAGHIVFSNNAILVGPTLGVATATSVNGLTLTANATGFSIAGGTTSKTLTISNSLTLAGTDGTTMTFPGVSTTICGTNTVCTGYQASLTGTGVVRIVSGTQTAVNDTTAATGAVAVANNGGPFTFNNPGLTESRALTSNDTLACPNSTSQNDNNHTLRLRSGITTLTVPLSSASGCPGTVFAVVDDGAGTVAVNATTGDTFTIADGTNNTDLATSFNVTNGQYFIINQMAANLWLVRKVASGGGSGTVTSVALTVPTWLTVGGSPVTTSGTLAVTAATGQTSHQVIGTCGSATSFAPCALVSADLPAALASQTSINGLTITASTGTLTVANAKTFTVNNTLTLSGTDSSTLNIGGGGTLGTGAYATIANYAPLAGATFTGEVVTVASATGTAGLNLPQGAAPTSPVNGDLWTTSAGLYVRINGATVGPLSAGGGGTPCTLTALSLQYNNGGAFGCVPDVTFSTPHTLTVGASGIVDATAAASGAFKVKDLTASGSTAGFFQCTQGSTNSAGTTAILLQCPTSVTSYTRTLAGAAPSAISLSTWSTAGVETFTQLLGSQTYVATSADPGTTAGVGICSDGSHGLMLCNGSISSGGALNTNIGWKTFLVSQLGNYTTGNGYNVAIGATIEVTDEAYCGDTVTGGGSIRGYLQVTGTGPTTFAPLGSSSCGVRLASNFTYNTSTNLTNITGLSWVIPASTTQTYQCKGTYSQATAAATDAFGVNVSSAPTNIFAVMDAKTSLADAGTNATLPTSTTTGGVQIGTFTPGAFGTIGTVADIFPFELLITVENGATGAATVTPMIKTGSTSDAITVYRGSACYLVSQ